MNPRRALHRLSTYSSLSGAIQLNGNRPTVVRELLPYAAVKQFFDAYSRQKVLLLELAERVGKLETALNRCQ
ncbi:hypothetical protein SS50377_28435 [Spironucleus salmonicida]|uniref:Uncharacterized protein n=1 Tax=Spironucleus salmonicida TaxID=348837 RepID=V6LFE2_9EUKA|nr:hypothetical protein SS50377_28435 [Spironucleus salmonicida]|eukprot:EST43207.1 Hypothetical protein SS50377_17150 [Spironucleus salmonicida]